MSLQKVSETKPGQVERRNLCWFTNSDSFGDPECEKPLNTLELQAWQAFKWICSNFLRNFKSATYQKGVAEMLAAYKEMGCCTSLKMHFLHSHLEFFLKILKQLVMSRVNNFTKMSKQWKKGIKEFEMRA